MTEKVLNIVKKAISMAEDCGAYEVVDELTPLQEMFQRRYCREESVKNGVTGYCNSCCHEHEVCAKENGFENKEIFSAAQAHWTDHNDQGTHIGVDRSTGHDTTAICKACRSGNGFKLKEYSIIQRGQRRHNEKVQEAQKG
jgi:hypothetical protein